MTNDPLCPKTDAIRKIKIFINPCPGDGYHVWDAFLGHFPPLQEPRPVACFLGEPIRDRFSLSFLFSRWLRYWRKSLYLLLHFNFLPFQIVFLFVMKHYQCSSHLPLEYLLCPMECFWDHVRSCHHRRISFFSLFRTLRISVSCGQTDGIWYVQEVGKRLKHDMFKTTGAQYHVTSSHLEIMSMKLNTLSISWTVLSRLLPTNNGGFSFDARITRSFLVEVYLFDGVRVFHF